jgi:hypothetical protein
MVLYLCILYNKVSPRLSTGQTEENNGKNAITM